MSHPAKLPIERLLKDCQVQRTRRSGPGGQHRNKVETAVVVEHLPTQLRGEGSERRSQEQNRRQAIQRLRVKLALDIRTPVTGEPSSLWKERSVGRQVPVNPQHDDFPALLAEALDVLLACEFALPATAERLGVSSSQLVKFLKIENDAFALVNRQRKSLGLPPLK